MSTPLRLYHQTLVYRSSLVLLYRAFSGGFNILIRHQLQNHFDHCFSRCTSIRSQTPQRDFAGGVIDLRHVLAFKFCLSLASACNVSNRTAGLDDTLLVDGPWPNSRSSRENSSISASTSFGGWCLKPIPQNASSATLCQTENVSFVGGSAFTCPAICHIELAKTLCTIRWKPRGFMPAVSFPFTWWSILFFIFPHLIFLFHIMFSIVRSILCVTNMLVLVRRFVKVRRVYRHWIITYEVCRACNIAVSSYDICHLQFLPRSSLSPPASATKDDRKVSLSTWLARADREVCAAFN
jgi:hypothetical protein